MPSAVASFVMWAANLIGGSWAGMTAFNVIYTAIELAVYASISFVGAKLFGPDEIGVDTSRAVTTRGTVEPQKLIYGETVVSGPIVYLNAGGVKNRELWHVLALAGHEVESITDIYLGNTKITNAEINSGAAAGGDVTSGTFGPHRTNAAMSVYKYLGTSSQTANSVLVARFNEWTTSHRGRGIAYVAVSFNLWDATDTIWKEHSGKNIKARIKGKNDIYDPRLEGAAGGTAGASPTNASYQAWTDNPALIAVDYLMNEKFGMNIGASRINWSACITAADACDVSVSVPGSATEKRFTCNGVLYGNKTHKVNVQSILSSMNGTMLYAAGQYVVQAGIYTAPTITLTDDDLAGAQVHVATSAARSDRFNQIRGQFFDKDDNYTQKEFPLVDPGTYVTRDAGIELPRAITLNMTDSFYMAQRLALKLLLQQDQQMTVSAQFNYSALQLAVGDRVNLNISEMSWAPKIFLVVGMRIVEDDDFAVSLELKEDASAAYADPAVSDYVTRTAAGSLVMNGTEVPAPTSTAVSAVVDGNRVTWSLPEDEAVIETVDVYASATNSWDDAERVGSTNGTTFFHPLAAGTARYYWTRAVLGRFESDRDPDSDTSTITATADASMVVDNPLAAFISLDGGTTYSPSATTQTVIVSAIANGMSTATVTWTRSGANVSNGTISGSGFTISAFGSAATTKTLTVTHTSSSETVSVSCEVTTVDVTGGSGK